MTSLPKKSRLKIASLIIVCFFAAAGLFVLWLYQGTFTAAKKRIFRFAHLPVAVVSGSLINLNEIDARTVLAKQISAPSTAVFQAIIAERATEAIAEQHGVTVSKQDITSEYNAFLKQSGSSRDFNMTPTQFQNNVLTSELRVTKLNIWYNGQRNINSVTFSRLDQVRQDLAFGASFSEQIKRYSDDSASLPFSGDLGFINASDLLPEISEGLSNAKVDDMVYMTSRYGQHVIQVIAKNGAQMHLRGLFLKQTGFMDWYQQQVQAVPVRILVRLN